MTSERRPLFRFGPPERRGLIGHARPGQLAVVATALVVSIGILHALPAGIAIAIALVCVLGAVAFAFAPVGGETPQGWLPVVASYLGRRAAGRGRAVGAPLRTGQVLHPPGVLGDLRVVELGQGSRSLGALHDAREATWTAVLAVQPVALALGGTEARDRFIAAWARVLAGASTSTSLHRIQWIERTVPDRADALRAAIEAALARPGAPEAARRSYGELVSSSVGALRHECHLAVTVRGPRRPSGAEAARLYVMLEEEVERLAARCRDAGLAADAALSADALSVVLRGSTEALPGTRPGWPWPIALEESWDQVLTDGTVHAAYWVAEWPRSEVPGDFLVPLLAGAGARRTVSVTAAPLGARRALHDAERARTADRADAALRSRHGFALTARSRHDHTAVLRREQELAEGHAAFKFSGYVIVTASDGVELRRACARVEQAAALARLDLRRLFGAQAEGFCAALPIGRGCA